MEEEKIPSSNNFKIKLKVIPNSNQGDDYELEEGEIREDYIDNDIDNPSISGNNQDQEPLINVGLRVCPYCNKGFTNGKALGGHMRIHAENYTQPKSSKPKPNGGPSSSPNPDPDKPIRCSLCDKEFRSQKSLFGHMRSHPDRHWRGMNPPAEVSGSGEPEPDEDSGRFERCTAAVERLSGFFGWGVTGRRGQNASTSDQMSTSATSGDHLAELAAEELLMLKRGHDDGDDDDGVLKKKKKKMKVYDDDEMYFLQDLNHDDGNDDDDDDGEKKKGGKWKCNTCNKTFTTHQALGGHRSSHNKEKINNNIIIHTHTESHNGSGLIESGSSGVGIGVHKCKICDKTFPSGQALGGHQRCHYVPQFDQDPNESSPGRSTSQTGRKGNVVLELDLNVAPEEEVEVEDCAVESTLEFVSS